MSKDSIRVRNFFSTILSLSLATCLVLSSFLTHTTEYVFNGDVNQTEISTSQLEQEYNHHFNETQNALMVAYFSVEKEEEDFISKKKELLFGTILRVLWSYSTVDFGNLSSIEYAEFPVVKIFEPCYIEYCSLKIPS